MRYLKTKYYPVDVENHIIYNDPAPRESDCSLYRGYANKNTIGIKGIRLQMFACYESFTLKEAHPQ